ncbi:hypothetical protein A4G99_04000 [Haladaptatus sp. R4]|uniref:endonuclease dU n=1 Tax=Haladaptatus sp. R4 TaxID=1679489 RepID=UPI0007B46EF8|nr:DUF99 family protein [Haladaptatus sp. R4]KZN25636.1 hypothetical protein A4G99_04000 [Haladaptatus sp. R4]
MKSGVRALGVAESYRRDTSTLAGVVTRASRVTDGFVFGTCTVGGTDLTDSIIDLVERLDREDVRYVMVSGIALAWYNVLDMHRLHDAVDRPVIDVTFEESDGLLESLESEFSGDELDQRRETYRKQPPRREIAVDGETVFVRHVGMDADEATEVVRAFTPEGGRPEPLRVARLAARAVDDFETVRPNGNETGSDDADEF